MIKVLQINAGSENFGGVSSFLLNVYRNIDHDKIQFDFLTPNITTYGDYKDEMQSLGAHIYNFHIDNDTLVGKFRFAASLMRFLKDHPYDIIHINSGCLSFNCISALAVRSSDKKIKIIVHSHNADDKNILKKICGVPLKMLMESCASLLMACSVPAARMMFLSATVDKGRVKIIKNGISVDRFAFNEAERDYLRQELGIEDSFVVGHIGRFTKQKNQDFLIDIFKELSVKDHNAVLLLIGRGELKDYIKEKAQGLGLEDKVLFLDQRKDAYRFYQAMDVFVLPSLYEGVPLTVIEAQAAGLLCFISADISQDVCVTDLVRRISLRNGAEAWAEVILSDHNEYRRDHGSEIIAAGYSTQDTALKLTEIYEDLVNG